MICVWRHLFAMVAALVAVVAAHSANAMKIERVVSPGGIEAWLVRDSSLPLIAMNFSFLGGANQDPGNKPGIGYLASTLLEDGAGELDAKAFQQQLDEHAIELRFSVTHDYFQGSIRMLRDRQAQSFDLLRLALTQPRFDADAVARAREQVLATLRRETTDPNAIATQTWWRTAFPGHPYERPNKGTLTSVPTVTVDDLRSYVGRVLTRRHLKIAVVGDIEAATLGKALDQVFGPLPANGELTPIPDASVRSAGKRIVAELNVPQAVMRLGGVGIPRKDPDFMAAYLVNHILGGGSFTSRLYDEVREKRGLAYGVYSYLLNLRHSAMFMASTQTSAETTREALELIEAQIRRMTEEGPTEDELVKAKNYLKGSYALNFDTSTKIASMLLQIQVEDLGIDYIERRNRLIDAVTIQDARRAAKRLAQGGMLTTVVGRPKGLESN